MVDAEIVVGLGVLVVEIGWAVVEIGLDVVELGWAVVKIGLDVVELGRDVVELGWDVVGVIVVEIGLEVELDDVMLVEGETVVGFGVTVFPCKYW